MARDSTRTPGLIAPFGIVAVCPVAMTESSIKQSHPVMDCNLQLSRAKSKAPGPELPVPNLFVGIHQANEIATADQLDATDTVAVVDSPLFKIVS